MTFNVRGSKKTEDQSAWAAGGGGPSSTGIARDDEEEEFDSPETIQAIADAIRRNGHEVELLGEGEPLLGRLLAGPRPELVFNFAEGTGQARTREARVPAVLEMLGIPYTGSDPLTLAVSLDKDCAKRLVRASGVPTPAWTLYQGDLRAIEPKVKELTFPLFVKPAYEGSSKGVIGNNFVPSAVDLRPLLDKLYAAYRQPILIEEFIEGDELTVGVLGNCPPQVLGVMRVLPKEVTKAPFVYDLEKKRDWENQLRYECPAQLSPADMGTVEQAALTVFRALGCRDLARIDFRFRGGVPYFLEVNPLPGLSPKSGDMVMIARGVGIEHDDLIGRIVAMAAERLAAS